MLMSGGQEFLIVGINDIFEWFPNGCVEVFVAGVSCGELIARKLKHGLSGAVDHFDHVLDVLVVTDVRYLPFDAIVPLMGCTTYGRDLELRLHVLSNVLQLYDVFVRTDVRLMHPFLRRPTLRVLQEV